MYHQPYLQLEALTTEQQASEVTDKFIVHH